MQCPNCGMDMKQATECAHCGARVVRHPSGRQYADTGPRRGLPLAATLIIFTALIGTAALFYLKSDTYLTLKAKRHYNRGEYARSVEILYEIMLRTGPSRERLLLASDSLLAQGKQHMNESNFLFAIPLFEEIITINEVAMATGGSDYSILLAKYEKGICLLRLAQEEGTYVEPFGDYILEAESIIDEAIWLAKELLDPDAKKIGADLHILASTVACERASAFWHNREMGHARNQLLRAEEQFELAARTGASEEKLDFLQEELTKLRVRIL